jgi:competence protein ComEA
MLMAGAGSVASAQTYEDMLTDEEKRALEAALPNEPAKEPLLRICGTCHSMVNVMKSPKTRQDWNMTIGIMMNRGAEGTNEEFDEILEYLTKHFGPKKPGENAAPAPQKVNVNKATAKELAAGLEVSAAEAEALVSHREKNGPFKEWQDLTKVRGVEAKKIEAKKDRLVF